MFVLLIAILASSFSFGITEEKNIEDEYSEEYTDDKSDVSLENEGEDCMPGGGGMPPPPPPEGEFPEETTDARQRRGRSRSGRNRSRSQQRSQRSTQRPKTTPEGRETESPTSERQTAKAAKARARARRTSRSIEESNMMQLSPLCEEYLKQTYETLRRNRQLRTCTGNDRMECEWTEMMKVRNAMLEEYPECYQQAQMFYNGDVQQVDLIASHVETD